MITQMLRQIGVLAIGSSKLVVKYVFVGLVASIVGRGHNISPTERVRKTCNLQVCLRKPITLIGVCRDATVGAANSRPLLFRQQKCIRLSETLKSKNVFGRLIAAPTVAMQRVWKSTNTNLSGKLSDPDRCISVYHTFFI